MGGADHPEVIQYEAGSDFAFALVCANAISGRTVCYLDDRTCALPENIWSRAASLSGGVTLLKLALGCSVT